MLQMMLMAAMMSQPQTAPVSQFQPCVWPNRCAVETVAQFQPCVWPNRCAAQPAAVPGPISTCDWPNSCS